MKRFLLLSIVCAGFAVLAEPTEGYKGSPPYSSGTTPGRFALCYGNVNNPVVDCKEPIMLRIDTCTGQVWELKSKVIARDQSTDKAAVWQSIWQIVDEPGSHRDWMSEQNFKVSGN